MKNLKLGKVLILLCILFISCSKEVNAPASAEIISAELQKVIREQNISRVIPWDYNTPFPNALYEEAGKNFTFSKGFIYLNSFGYDAYNLDKVKTYKTVNVSIMNVNGTVVSTDKALIIFFD